MKTSDQIKTELYPLLSSHVISSILDYFIDTLKESLNNNEVLPNHTKMMNSKWKSVILQFNKDTNSDYYHPDLFLILFSRNFKSQLKESNTPKLRRMQQSYKINHNIDIEKLSKTSCGMLDDADKLITEANKSHE